MIIREATLDDALAIARIHVDTWRTTYRGIVPDEYLANLSYQQRAERWYKTLSCAPEAGDFTYVAEAEPGNMLGFANGGVERTRDPLYKGELRAIYIQQRHQGQRIGRSLVQAITKKLHLLEINSMMVWVFLDNPACQFYTALGGKLVHEKEFELGGKNLTELAYGWLDTENLRGG
jgi:GNAT superfamily N-acetyltransferase